MRPFTLPNQVITRGNTYKESYTVTSNGLPYDFSQYTSIKMDIRKDKDNKSALLHSISLENGIDIEGNDNNTLIITIPANVTKEWAKSIYHRDIKFYNSNGEEYTYFDGIIQVLNNIT